MARRTTNTYGNKLQSKNSHNNYRYDNEGTGGGFYYSNNDGSTYHKSASGKSTFTSASGKKTVRYE